MAALRTAIVMTASLSAPIGLVTVAPMVMEGPYKTGGPAVEITQQQERMKLSQLGYAGKRLYLKNCVECHGEEAKGAQRGVSLVSQSYHRENFSKRAFHSAVRPENMEQLASIDSSHVFPGLSFNQVEQLERYIRELQNPFDFQ